MTIRAYRITQKKYAEAAFDGEGARLYGGRWNSVGTPLIYVASSLSLATLELLVHLEDYSTIQGLYVVIPVDFNETLVTTLAASELSSCWNAPVLNSETQLIGDRWAASLSSVALSVPSAVTANEVNYLLNPIHPDFSKLLIGTPQSLELDPRLLT